MATNIISVSLTDIDSNLKRILRIQLKEFLHYLEETPQEKNREYGIRYLRITVCQMPDGKVA